MPLKQTFQLQNLQYISMYVHMHSVLPFMQAMMCWVLSRVILSLSPHKTQMNVILHVYAATFRAHLVSLAMLRYVVGPCGRAAIEEKSVLVVFRICSISVTAYTYTKDEMSHYTLSQALTKEIVKWPCRKHSCWAFQSGTTSLGLVVQHSDHLHR